MSMAFAFDLDGTLLDTECLWARATAAFLRSHGEPVEIADAIDLVYGRSWRDIHADICRRYPHANLPLADATRAVRHHMLAIREGVDYVIPGSVALLRRLAENYPVCVVSGSPRQDVADGVQVAGIANDIRFLLGAEDYTPGKPDPACYRLAARRLGVRPDAVTVFEDSTAGVRAARAAGMYTVALARPGLPEQDLSMAHVVVPDLADFDSNTHGYHCRRAAMLDPVNAFPVF